MKCRALLDTQWQNQRQSSAKTKILSRWSTQRIQKPVSRLNYENSPPANERIFKLNFQTVDSWRREFDLLMLHKIIHGQSGLQQGSLFLWGLVSLGISRANLPYLARARLNCRKYIFADRIYAEFFGLSKKAKIPSSYSYFKKKKTCKGSPRCLMNTSAQFSSLF